MPRRAFKRDEVHRGIGQRKICAKAAPHHVARIAPEQQDTGVGEQPRDQRQARAFERVHIDKAARGRRHTGAGHRQPVCAALRRCGWLIKRLQLRQSRPGFSQKCGVRSAQRGPLLQRGDPRERSQHVFEQSVARARIAEHEQVARAGAGRRRGGGQPRRWIQRGKRGADRFDPGPVRRTPVKLGSMKRRKVSLRLRVSRIGRWCIAQPVIGIAEHAVQLNTLGIGLRAPRSERCDQAARGFGITCFKCQPGQRGGGNRIVWVGCQCRQGVVAPRRPVALARRHRSKPGVRGRAVRGQGDNPRVAFACRWHCAAGMHDERAFKPRFGISGVRGNRAVAQPDCFA